MAQNRRGRRGRSSETESPSQEGGNGNGNGKSRAGSGRAKRRGAQPAESQLNHWPEHRVIVIGASAGGVEALYRVVGALPASLPAAVFVVLHIPPQGPSLLPEILNRAKGMPAAHPKDGEPIKPGRIYVAPPDSHLLVKPGKIVVSRGPRENNARPAVDPLFRTAAQSYGPWTIGVVLTGGLDDGTLGLMAIKRDGGIAIVQDPADALFPGMPASAAENSNPDYVVPLDEMGPLLDRVSRTPIAHETGANFMSRAKRSAPDVAEVGTDALKSGMLPGAPSKFTCPECGGALWEMQDGKLVRYRCHVGHGYTADTLLAAQDKSLEDVLWSALRALEESAGLRRRMAERARKGNLVTMIDRYEEQAREMESRAGVLRSVLAVHEPSGSRRGQEIERKAIAARDPTITRRTRDSASRGANQKRARSR